MAISTCSMTSFWPTITFEQLVADAVVRLFAALDGGDVVLVVRTW